MATKLVEADPLFANWFLKYWQKVVEGLEDLKTRKFKDLDEYLENRVPDSGFE
jgi:hypothetical protein